MNNSELIAELTNRLQWTNENVSLALQATADTISEKLLENRIVFFPGLGLFCTEKRVETIHVDEATGQRYLYPPAIVVTFFMQNSSDFQLIVAANEVYSLAEALLAKTELSREEVLAFLNELKYIITSVNESDCVTIDNLGTFKYLSGSSDETSQKNISFTPDESLKDSVNKPFAHFEAVLLHEEFNAEGIESVQVSSEEIEKPENEQLLQSNLQKAAEEASKAIEEEEEEKQEETENKITKQQTFSGSDKNRSASRVVLYFIAGGLILAASAFLLTKNRDK